MVIGESLNAIENYYYSFVLLIYLDRIQFRFRFRFIQFVARILQYYERKTIDFIELIETATSNELKLSIISFSFFVTFCDT